MNDAAKRQKQRQASSAQNDQKIKKWYWYDVIAWIAVIGTFFPLVLVIITCGIAGIVITGSFIIFAVVFEDFVKGD